MGRILRSRRVRGEDVDGRGGEGRGCKDGGGQRGGVGSSNDDNHKVEGEGRDDPIKELAQTETTRRGPLGSTEES